MIAPGSELSIARQARLLGVSRSSVYYRPKPESSEELDLLKCVFRAIVTGDFAEA